MITLVQLQTAQNDYHSSREDLSDIARAIHHLRTGGTLAGYGFDGWRTSIDDGEDEDDGVIFAPGTPIVEVDFYHGRWNDGVSVRFPASYLDGTNDYLEIEKGAIEDRKRIAAEQHEREEAARDLAAADDRRAEYDRLRQEFG
jgi:hypothetical protein